MPPLGFQSIGVTKDWQLLLNLCVIIDFRRRFQSIGVTKDWRLRSAQIHSPGGTAFPINRRHQRLATRILTRPLANCFGAGFQSIGVIKDWRPGSDRAGSGPSLCGFPINRGHQRLATSQTAHALRMCFSRFPINRRYQGLATLGLGISGGQFSEFPINRRHQGLATSTSQQIAGTQEHSFQSIGVTKDWRPNKTGEWSINCERRVSNQ